ncbi:MAG: protease inhibitor I42 family protein [Verrucomicrobia bacterium]|nr:protease inhibitor I42 family protein [Verrucomicrobiota bacterium]
MYRMILFVIGAGVWWALSGCAATSAPSELKLGKTHAGKSFDLAKGGVLEITLEGNPTTGYLWSLLSGNDAVLKPAGSYAYKQDAAAAGMVGVGGKFTFKFQAVGAGAAQLKFGYLRPWEANVPPVEMFQANITVR